VLRAASKAIGRRDDRQQIASILGHLALDGDRAAAQALLRMVDVNVPCETVAVGAMWALGEEAWRRVIRSYGRRWDEAGRFDWGWIVHFARAEVGARRMPAVLRDEASRRKGLGPLVWCVELEAWRDARSRRPEREVDATLDGLERLVASPRLRSVASDLRRWTRRASVAHRKEAWRRLLAERSPSRLLRRLRAWSWETPPSIHPSLFELLEHRDRRVRVAAAGVLRKFEDARIRKIALRLLREDALRALDDCVLWLLERNADDDDAAAIDAALPRVASRETRNDWVTGVVGIVDPLERSARPRRSSVWTPLLLRALETAPCRDCRERVLGLLVQRGAATEPMLREALLDANSETRELARESLSKLRPARARGGSRGRHSAASAGP
jgi:hypothetical protein